MANKVRLTWRGLRELRETLSTLAVDFTNDAQPMIEQSAEGAANAIRAGYPRRSGTLANSVIVKQRNKGDTAVAYAVINTAFYAHMYEYGTRYAAPGRVFIPIRNRFQRALYDTLERTLLPKYGFNETTGDAMDE